MSRDHTPATENRIFTIPNFLSAFRIVLIPVIIWLYCGKQSYYAAFFVLLLSGVTDLVDGYIARRFHMVSKLGKALDPIADKLTQGATLICLGTRFPEMWILAIALVVKEAVTGVLTLLAIRKTSEIKGADWHGKIATCLLYAVMLAHMLWPGMPGWITMVLTGICLAAMMTSFILYVKRNLADIRRRT